MNVEQDPAGGPGTHLLSVEVSFHDIENSSMEEVNRVIKLIRGYRISVLYFPRRSEWTYPVRAQVLLDRILVYGSPDTVIFPYYSD